MAAMLLPVLLLVTACQTTNTAATDRDGDSWACLAFKPIRWSSHDTKETLDQIAEHNAIWEAECGVN
jgi:hypothetical protein